MPNGQKVAKQDKSWGHVCSRSMFLVIIQWCQHPLFLDLWTCSSEGQVPFAARCWSSVTLKKDKNSLEREKQDYLIFLSLSKKDSPVIKQQREDASKIFQGTKRIDLYDIQKKGVIIKVCDYEKKKFDV